MATKQDAVICDIDGVILDSSQVFKEIEELGLTGDAKWEYFNRHANNGANVYWDMVDVIKPFIEMGYKIIFLTARCETIKEETTETVIGAFRGAFFYSHEYEFVMRPKGVKLPSAEVKEKHLLELKKKYDILCAFDDDESNCEMFRKHNILTFKV